MAVWRPVLALRQAAGDISDWLFGPWQDDRPCSDYGYRDWSEREYQVRTRLAGVILKRTIERDEAIERADLLAAELAAARREIELLKAQATEGARDD